jgi:hypothetical protein
MSRKHPERSGRCSSRSGSFSQAASRPATDSTLHLNLIDGEKIWELVERKGMGLRQTTIFDAVWFDRLD